MGDPRDIGGVVDSSNLGRPAAFVYDKYPGGIGFAEKAYEWIEQIMVAALELITECPCRYGCPSCVGAAMPAGGAEGPQDRDLVPDKDAALILLHSMLQREPYEPRERKPPAEGQARRREPSRPAPTVVTPLPASVEAKIRKRMRTMRSER